MKTAYAAYLPALTACLLWGAATHAHPTMAEGLSVLFSSVPRG